MISKQHLMMGEIIMEQQFNKRIITFNEYLRTMDMAIGGLGIFLRNKRKKIISEEFSERLMLTVTEVNGCELCSYGHTKVALEAGISPHEIQSMLSGAGCQYPEDESVAIFFAQHYAESGGNPDKEALSRFFQIYKKAEAESILSVIRMIMLGNGLGIALGAIKDRLKGAPIKKSHLGRELGVIFGGFLISPLLIIKNIFPPTRNKIRFITS